MKLFLHDLQISYSSEQLFIKFGNIDATINWDDELLKERYYIYEAPSEESAFKVFCFDKK